MREQLLDDMVARQFLLGQLPPEEQGRIEELAFEDVDTFAFLESVEDDLIDEFLQGDLSVDEEEQFKHHFLSLPGRRENLKISRVLQRHFNIPAAVSHEQEFSLTGWFKQQSAWVQIPVTVAMLGLIIVAVWIFTRIWQARQPEPIQAGPDRPVAVPSPSFKISPSVEPSASPIHAENKPKSGTPEKQRRPAAYALLSPSALTRGEGLQQLKLPPDAPSMTLELPLITRTNFRTYEAAIENEAGTVLQRWPNLKTQRLTSGKALKVELPTALLKDQEFYRIVVSGVSPKRETEVVARYPFEVIR